MCHGVLVDRGEIERGRTLATPPLTGRDELIDELERSVGTSRHLLLRGPAGVGKTRLAAELCAGPASERRVVDRLLASETTSSFQLGALASLGRPAGVGPGDLPAIVSWYLGRWRSQQRNGRPPLVWLDDAQHVDDLSANVLRQAVALGCAQLIATHRTPELLPDDIEALVVEGQLDIVEVPALESGASGALADRTAGRPLTNGQKDRIFALSAGVPLYVRDLALGLNGSDDLPRVSDLSDVIGARFAGLTPSGRRTAEMIAAAEPLDLTVLSDRASDVSTLLSLGLARRQGDGDVRLEHPLYGAWLLDALGPLVADLYRELADRAGPGLVDPVQEADWRLQAGDRLSGELTTEAAGLAITRSDGATALRFLGDRNGSELLRGEALLLVGDVEQGLAALDRVRGEAIAAERVEAASWLARYIGVGLGDHERAHRILEEADDPSLDAELRRLLLIGRLWLWMFGPGTPSDVLERVNELLDTESFDQPSYELALCGAGLVYHVHDPDEAAPLVEYVRRAENEIEVDPQSVCRARAIEGWLHIFNGEPHRGVDLMVDHFEVAKAESNSEGMGLVGATAALAAALEGRIREALTLAGQAVAATEGYDPFRYGVLAHDILRGTLVLAGLPAESRRTAPAANGPVGFADLEATFIARADLLEAQRAGRLLDLRPLLDSYELFASNLKVSWISALSSEFFDRTIPDEAHRFVHSALAGREHIALHRRVIDAAAARLDRDHERLLSVAGEFECHGYLAAASRSFADVAVLEPLDSPLRPAAIQGLLRSLRHWDGGPTWWTDDVVGLPTPRQLEIMWQVVDGERPPALARRLDLSTRTIENHLYRVYRSLGLSGQDELVAVMKSVTTQAE